MSIAFRDDSQVTHVHAIKSYALAAPSTRIEIQPASEDRDEGRRA